MLLTWMAYATLTGALVCAGALALDALALRRGLATRFIWLAALIVAVAAPVFVGLRTSRYELPRQRVESPLPTRVVSPASKTAAAFATPRANQAARLRVRILV